MPPHNTPDLNLLPCSAPEAACFKGLYPSGSLGCRRVYRASVLQDLAFLPCSCLSFWGSERIKSVLPDTPHCSCSRRRRAFQRSEGLIWWPSRCSRKPLTVPSTTFFVSKKQINACLSCTWASFNSLLAIPLTILRYIKWHTDAGRLD